MIDEIKKEIAFCEKDFFDWSHGGKIYKIPYFGPCTPDCLVEMADLIDEGKLIGKPSELRQFMSDFCFNLVSILNDVDRDETDTLTNAKTHKELFSLWLGE